MPILLSHIKTLSDTSRETSLRSTKHKKTGSLVNEKLFPQGFFDSSSKKPFSVDRNEDINNNYSLSNRKNDKKHIHMIQHPIAITKVANTNITGENDNFNINLFLKQNKKVINLEPKFKCLDLDLGRVENNAEGAKKRRIISPAIFGSKSRQLNFVEGEQKQLKVNLKIVNENINKKIEIQNSSKKTHLPTLQTPSKKVNNQTSDNETTENTNTNSKINRYIFQIISNDIHLIFKVFLK